MASHPFTAIIQQRRSDLVLAGLKWHTIFSTDLRERERQVDEFVQANAIELMCVLEFSGGLQVGYCERMRLPLVEQRSVRWISFAMVVRKYFQTGSLLMVWRATCPDGADSYAVLVFEEGLLILDRVVEASAVEDVITTYLENTGVKTGVQLLSNDAQLFPEFTDIGELDWISDDLDGVRLRPPRAMRLIDAERRPVQAVFIIVSLIGLSVAIAWYVWTSFIAKPKPAPIKPRASAQELYMRKVTEEIGSLGFDSHGVRDLIMNLMDTKLVYEGWQLKSVRCTLSECEFLWNGSPGTDPRLLDGFGQRDMSAHNQKPGQVMIRRLHSISPKGVITPDRLRSKIDARLYCEREELILKNLKLRASAQCKGKSWPEMVGRISGDYAIDRFSLKLMTDWVTLDRLLDRYEDAIFWREVKVLVKPDAIDLTDLMLFELSGDLYGYR